MELRRNRLPWALGAGLLLLLLLAGVALAAAEATKRPTFELVARVNPGKAWNGDVVAHRGHAYLSSWGRASSVCDALGVRVYSLANVRRPRLVSTFANAGSQPRLAGTWTEKTIVRRVSTPSFRGDLAVTSVQDCRPSSFQGFALYDLTNPAQPRELALVPTQPRGAHELWLQRVGTRVYVWAALPGAELSSSRAGQPGGADFRVWDVSDPRAPRQVGQWGAWKELGLRPDAGAEAFYDWNMVHSVTGNPSGSRAYLSYWDLGTVILDMTNPAAPRYLGRTAPRPGDVDNAHSTWLAKRGTVMIETLERDGGRPSLWNIADPSRPVKLSEFRLPRAVVALGRRDHLERISGLDLNDSVHDPKVVGDVAYFSWYRQGVVAVDIKDPRKPRFLARFLPPPTRDPGGTFCGNGSACTSVWGVAQYGQYMLASDMVGGLFVLRLRR